MSISAVGGCFHRWALQYSMCVLDVLGPLRLWRAAHGMRVSWHCIYMLKTLDMNTELLQLSCMGQQSMHGDL